MKKIAVIVGHGRSKKGGYDPGVCANGLEEFQLAKECAGYAQEELRQYDCQAELFNYAGDTYLTDRVKQFRDDSYALIAELHLNAGGGTGPEVYYSNGDSAGKRAAEQIAARIASAFSLRNRGAKVKLGSSGKDCFAIIRDTVPTAVLVETLFIDSQEVFAVSTPEGQQKMGKAIAEGIAAALELKKAAGSAPVQPTGLAVGDIVRVKRGAKSYEGKKIASFIYDREYRVDELKGDRAVLDKKGICTAFHVDDLVLVKTEAPPKPVETAMPYRVKCLSTWVRKADAAGGLLEIYYRGKIVEVVGISGRYSKFRYGKKGLEYAYIPTRYLEKL